METKNSNSINGNVGFCGLLTILFIGLKLGKVIDWSWWWVTAPLWGSAALIISILLGIATVAGLLKIFVK